MVTASQVFAECTYLRCYDICEIQFNQVQLLVSFRDFDLGCPSLCTVNPTKHQQQTGNQWGAPASCGSVRAWSSGGLQLCGAAAVPRQNCSSTSPVCLCSNISSAAHRFFFSLFYFLLISRKCSSAPFPFPSCSAVWALPLWMLALAWGWLLGKSLFLQKSQHLPQLNPSRWLYI